MRRFDCEAILLEVSDLSEGDRVVVFLTREHGTKRAAARGARRRYSRFAGRLLPLARVRVSWFEKEGRDLARLGDADLLRPANAVQQTLEGALVGAYLCEQMSLFAQENEASDRLFRLLDATTEAMLAGASPLLCARYYELWMLKLAGLLGDSAICPLCERSLAPQAVLPDDGETLLCADCARGTAGRRFAASTLDLMARFERIPPGALADLGVEGAAVRELQVLCAEIRRRFLGHELRSYRVMERTLAEVGTESTS